MSWELVHAAATEINAQIDERSPVWFYLNREQQPRPRFTATGPDPDDVERILIELAGEDERLIRIIRRTFWRLKCEPE